MSDLIRTFFNGSDILEIHVAAAHLSSYSRGAAQSAAKGFSVDLKWVHVFRVIPVDCSDNHYYYL